MIFTRCSFSDGIECIRAKIWEADQKSLPFNALQLTIRILLCVFRITSVASDFTRIAKIYLLITALDTSSSQRCEDGAIQEGIKAVVRSIRRQEYRSQSVHLVFF